MQSKKIRSSEITPEHEYLSRRRMLKLGGIALSSAMLTACGGQLGDMLSSRNRPKQLPAQAQPTSSSAQAAGATPNAAAGSTPNATAPAISLVKVDELGDPANSYDDITNYNNFYEFTEDKQGVAPLAQGFQPNTWTLTVGGLVGKLTAGGLGSQVASWVGTGPNQPVTGDQVAAALGEDQIGQLAQKFGIPNSAVAGHLSQILPELINHLTPNGSVPDQSAVQSAIGLLKGKLFGN